MFNIITETLFKDQTKLTGADSSGVPPLGIRGGEGELLQ